MISDTQLRHALVALGAKDVPEILFELTKEPGEEFNVHLKTPPYIFTRVEDILDGVEIFQEAGLNAVIDLVGERIVMRFHPHAKRTAPTQLAKILEKFYFQRRPQVTFWERIRKFLYD